MKPSSLITFFVAVMATFFVAVMAVVLIDHVIGTHKAASVDPATVEMTVTVEMTAQLKHIANSLERISVSLETISGQRAGWKIPSK